MTETMHSTYESAGLKLIPLVPRSKECRRRGWTTNGFPIGQFPSDANVGVTLGPSNLLDVDLDCDEAVALAPTILPESGMMVARGGLPTHYLFRGAGKRRVWSGDAGVIVELRGTDCYTMIPPSTHPNGNPLTWSDRAGHPLEYPGQPGECSREELVKRLGLLAVLASVLGSWKALAGQHHAAALSLGALLSVALEDTPPETVGKLVRTVAELGGDGDLADRERAARESSEKQRSGEPVRFNDLADMFGSGAVSRWQSWLAAKLGAAGQPKAARKSAEESRRELFEDPDVLAELERMNEKHFVNTSRDMRSYAFVVGDYYVRRSSFMNHYNNRRPASNPRESYGELWDAWPGRRSYDREDYWFGDSDETPAGMLNLWGGWPVEPVEPTDPEVRDAVTVFLDHITDVVCSGNVEHGTYFRHLLARKVQDPGWLARSIPVLIGGQGTGKSIVLDEYAALFGDHAASIRDKELFGAFNSWSQKLIVRADEVAAPRDRYRASQRIKILTEGRIALELKGVDSRAIQNRMLVLVSANDPNIVHVDHDDRRLFLPTVSDKRRNDYEYFSALCMHSYGEGPNPAFQAGLLWTLLNGVSVDQALTSGRPPASTLKAEQAEDSLSPLDMWLQDALANDVIEIPSEDGMSTAPAQLSGSWVSSTNLAASARRDTGDHRLTKHAVTRYVTRLLKRCKTGGRKTKLLAGHGVAGTKFGDLDDMRAAWEERCGPVDWSAGREPEQKTFATVR